MKSGNLAKFLKGLDTPGGTVTTKFLPQFLKIKLIGANLNNWCLFFQKKLIKLFYEQSRFPKFKYDI